MVDGYGTEKEGKEGRVCSPEGFQAGAGLRGSYSTSVRHTNSTWPLFEHPSSRHFLPSLLPSFFVSRVLSKFFPLRFSPERLHVDRSAHFVPPFPVAREHSVLLRPPTRFPLIHHLPSETSCSLSACTSFLSDHRRCCASVFLSPRIRYLPS